MSASTGTMPHRMLVHCMRSTVDLSYLGRKKSVRAVGDDVRNDDCLDDKEQGK